MVGLEPARKAYPTPGRELWEDAVELGDRCLERIVTKWVVLMQGRLKQKDAVANRGEKKQRLCEEACGTTGKGFGQYKNRNMLKSV